MRFSELTEAKLSKGEFKRRLQDPALVELEKIAEHAKSWARDIMNNGHDEYSFEVFNKGDTNFIRFSFDPYSDYLSDFTSEVKQRKTLNLIQDIRERVAASKYWVWDTWNADAAGVRAYVIEK